MQYFYPGLANTTLDNVYIYEWSWAVGFSFHLVPNPSTKKRIEKKINLSTGYLKGHNFKTKLK